MLGIVSIDEALEKASDAGLDLVELSPQADPPVCKILDYGKYRYESQRKIKEAKKKQKVVHLKEIKIRPTTDVHDYEVKLKSARKFIESGDKVKVSMRFRGREIAHKDLGEDKIKQFASDLSDIAKIEVEPKMEGKQMILIVAPA